MKITCRYLAVLPFFLYGCSSYQQISRNSFEQYHTPIEYRAQLTYVLKTNRLHYVGIDSKNHVNVYETVDRSRSNHFTYLVEDHIIIPRGATGICVNPSNDHFLVDFGEGVLVPFRILQNQNVPKGEITIDGGRYQLQLKRRIPSLYVRDDSLKSLHGYPFKKK